MSDTDVETDITNDIGALGRDPYRYALYAFPWDTGELTGVHGPRAWQREVMEQIRDHLSDPEMRCTPLRIARASGHGIGKSGLISMIVKWALDTCVDTRIIITANTEQQVLTKTSPELAKWARLAITKDWFNVNKTSIVSAMKGHDNAWRADLVTWSDNNTEAFAGLHNQGKRIVLVFDEASGISDKVWEVALGALTDENTEIIWLAFGNPTLNTGAFRECFGRHRNLWKTAQIDSRTVEGTNKAYLDELVATYGIESDIVKVRVLGQFPSASTMQFIPNDLAEAAMQRPVLAGLQSDPIVYGVDCARFGDDESVLAKRRGRDARSLPWKSWRSLDAMSLAGDIALESAREHPDAIFVDAGNIGAAIVDRLRQLIPDTPVIEVWFGGSGRQAELEPGVAVETANKRAEIWTRMRAWLRSGSMPDHERLRDDLIGPMYKFAADDTRVMLERKVDMKKRGLPSPDWADALACTFAEPVLPRAVPGYADPNNYRSEGDRYRELD